MTDRNIIKIVLITISVSAIVIRNVSCKKGRDPEITKALAEGKMILIDAKGVEHILPDSIRDQNRKSYQINDSIQNAIDLTPDEINSLDKLGINKKIVSDIKFIIHKSFETLEMENTSGKNIPQNMLPKMIQFNQVTKEYKKEIEAYISKNGFEKDIDHHWKNDFRQLKLYFIENSNQLYTAIISKI